MLNIKDVENTIICADCIDIMRQLPNKCIDLILCDPPYGLNKKIHDGGTWSRKEKFDDCLKWDFCVGGGYIKEIQRISKNQIIWGGNYYQLPPSRGWLVWVKPFFPTMSDAELAWTSFDMNTRVFNESRNPEGYKEHPTQKPISLMRWIIKNYSKETDLILDPFLGSGTTIIAAQELGRRWIGIEIAKKYCEIARKRLAYLTPNLF